MTSMVTRVSPTMKLGKNSSVTIEGGNVHKHLQQPLVSAEYSLYYESSLVCFGFELLKP